MKNAFLFLAMGAALTAAPITRVTLVDAGRPVLSDRTYDVGPYDLRIGGWVEPVLCIDVDDTDKIGAQWTAVVSNLSGDLRGTYHPLDRDEYAEEAYLFSLITKAGADRIDLQHAAWAITDSGYRANAAAEVFVRAAETNAWRVDLGRFEVISEAPGYKGAREQEFLGAAAPEPFWSDLLAGLIGVGLSLLGKKRG